MKTTWIFKFLLVSTVLLLSACAISPPTSFDYDTSYDFSGLKSYAWLEGAADTVSTLENKRQRNAIETILNRKGYILSSDPETASFLLKTHTITDKKIDIDRFYQNWGYYPAYYPGFFYPPHHGWPSRSTTTITEYKVGTLVLDIVDREKKQVVWQGSVTRSLGVYSKRTPEELASISLSNAEFLLANFPPEPPK